MLFLLSKNSYSLKSYLLGHMHLFVILRYRFYKPVPGSFSSFSLIQWLLSSIVIFTIWLLRWASSNRIISSSAGTSFIKFGFVSKCFRVYIPKKRYLVAVDYRFFNLFIVFISIAQIFFKVEGGMVGSCLGHKASSWIHSWGILLALKHWIYIFLFSHRSIRSILSKKLRGSHTWIVKL